MGRRSWKRWAKKRERERRATSSWERKNEVIPGKRSEIPATDGRRGFAAVKRAPFRWDEGGTGEEGERGHRREKRHRLRPCCIYHIITIIELRTTRRHLLILHLGHPRPTISLLPSCNPFLTAATANWKLANTFSLRSSRLEIVCRGMSIVGRAC